MSLHFTAMGYLFFCSGLGTGAQSSFITLNINFDVSFLPLNRCMLVFPLNIQDAAPSLLLFASCH